MVTDKLAQAIELLASCYDYGYDDQCEEIKQRHEMTWSAHLNLRSIEPEMGKQVKSVLDEFLDAQNEEHSLENIYAYLQGVKHGILFDQWVNNGDKLFFKERS